MSVVIPPVLPAPADAEKVIEALLSKRWASLRGMRPLQDLCLRDAEAYVVGSTVWRPALGLPRKDPPGDLDLLFADPAGLNVALAHVKMWNADHEQSPWLISGDDGYYDEPDHCVRVKDYASGGSGTVVMDLWVVPAGLTVEEHVLSFTEDYHRVAYYCGPCARSRLFRGIRQGTPPGGHK